MPRRSSGTQREEERWIARRVQWELGRRQWSYQKLANAMAEAGCPLNQSAVQRMIKGKPPRQIRAQELAALGEVFEQPVSRLLMPLDLALGEEANELLEALNVQRATYMAAAQQTYDTIRRIVRLLAEADRLDTGRFVNALAEAERTMINLLDLMLEAEAELRGERFEDWPDSSEMYDYER